MDSIHVSSQVLLIFALACIVGAACVAFARRVNHDAVDLKREALDAGSFLNAIGLPHSAAFWNAVALEDWPTAVKELHTIIGIFKSPELRTACVCKVVDQYIMEVLKDQDTDEVSRLQKLLGGTWAQAAAAPLPTGAAMQQISGFLNPTNYTAFGAAPMQAQGGTFLHTPAPIGVQPPSIATTVSHAVVAPAQAAAAVAAGVVQAAVAPAA